ncbi:TM2 domain-containing protein [Bacillus carboniphilus]|uniref:TM2 domain-containing protein n=1 Tax=Bacillus carboniphilus TaxID=86663 RepID=A0ABY9JQV5_9BACI|nr:TM2 domain-containing protein [Bacillus carboniphilus]WLR41784.1 TM2 domain-containing protein [Bacillus carboniphilus]
MSKKKKYISKKKWSITLLLCFFLPFFGAHRFFVGKVRSGVFMLITLGGLGIWSVADLIMIITGNFKDNEGKLIKTP